MKFRHVLTCAALLCAAALWISPAPAEAQTSCNLCDCSSGCSTTCTILVRECEPITQDGGGCTWETYYDTCGNHTCTTSQECGVCSNLTCTTSIYGTTGNDTINGTAARECIYGDYGNDTLDGKAGDDRLRGSNGTDTLFGDSGDDCMWGQANNDHLDGGSGYDFGEGNGGSNTCTASTEVQLNC